MSLIDVAKNAIADEPEEKTLKALGFLNGGFLHSDS